MTSSGRMLYFSLSQREEHLYEATLLTLTTFLTLQTMRLNKWVIGRKTQEIFSALSAWIILWVAPLHCCLLCVFFLEAFFCVFLMPAHFNAAPGPAPLSASVLSLSWRKISCKMEKHINLTVVQVVKTRKKLFSGTWVGEWGNWKTIGNGKGVLELKMNGPLAGLKKFRLLGTHSIWPRGCLKGKRKVSGWVMYGENKAACLVGPRLSNLEKIPTRHGLIPENLCQKR